MRLDSNFIGFYHMYFCCKTQKISSADSPPILYLEFQKGEGALLLAPVLLF